MQVPFDYAPDWLSAPLKPASLGMTGHFVIETSESGRLDRIGFPAAAIGAARFGFGAQLHCGEDAGEISPFAGAAADWGLHQQQPGNIRWP
jgi:hypothetical protein